MDDPENTVLPKVQYRVNSLKFDHFNLKYLNINSLRSKLFEIENDIYNNNTQIFHFIALTETRIFSNETGLFNLPNYKSYFSCRDDGHGGAALFIHESIDSNLTESGEMFKVNYVIVKIPSIKASIAVLYKKPTVSNSKFCTVLAHILHKTNKLILIGDMNIDIQKQNSNSSEYFSLINSLGCRLLNSSDRKYATRINKHINARNTKSSTIDHAITNCFNFRYNLCCNDSHLSDHREIVLSFGDNTNSLSKFHSNTTSFVTERLQIDKFQKLLSRELSIYTPHDFSALLHLIDSVKKRCILRRKYTRINNPYKKWVNTELINLISERNRYHKLSKKFPTNEFMKNNTMNFAFWPSPPIIVCAGHTTHHNLTNSSQSPVSFGNVLMKSFITSLILQMKSNPFLTIGALLCMTQN